jgi:glycosyltransferase involved in cell wall biosynthesis
MVISPSEQNVLQRPTISVVLPNFNHSHYIGKAIENVLRQSYAPAEIIIIDDGSTDGSVEIISALIVNKPAIRLVENGSNKGVIWTINRGLSLARSDYVFFQAADDYVFDTLFEKSIALLSRYPRAALCSGLCLCSFDDSADPTLFHSPIVSRMPTYIAPEMARRLLIGDDSWIMGNTAIYRRSDLAEMGGFDPSLQSFADGFAGQVLALRHGACFIPEALAVWRLGADGFANSCMRDPAVGRAICERASELMTTRFARIFPPSYVRRWRKSWLFGVAVAGHLAQLRDPTSRSLWRKVAAVWWIAAFLLKYRAFTFHRIALRRLRHITASRQALLTVRDGQREL